ncbi:MAG: dephospho-CoA kinase [Rhodobacteraceae bacterium]|nr:dephospho-CoA kinase [Paracoccaceae bacterium]
MGRRSIVIGITGSMGMGKSTVAGMIAQEGIPVWSADECVERLYGPGAAGTLAIAREFGMEFVDESGVSRARLRRLVLGNNEDMDRLERLIHPLVSKDRNEFVAQARRRRACCAVEIPLLFETGADREVDFVIVVSVPEQVQRDRLTARGTLEAWQIDALLSRQASDERKRERADFVVSSVSLSETRLQVAEVLSRIRERKTGPCVN